MATGNDFVSLQNIKNNICISKYNSEDLIGHNGRLFIAVDLIGKAFSEATSVDLVDKIATFFEKEENWRALQNCWIENDYSEELRKLLQKALKG